MKEVFFESVDFTRHIKDILEKDENDKIYDVDLEKINEVVLNTKNLRGMILDVNVRDLLLLQNLKSCYIKNMQLTDNEIGVLNKLSNLKELQLHNCWFLNKKEKLTLDIETLAIVNCYNFRSDILKKLKQLETLMVKPKVGVKEREFRRLKTLQRLYLEG